MGNRHYSLTDTFLINIDQALRTVFNHRQTTGRANPGLVQQSTLNSAERRQAARLMRVNHTGEVCAQALYQGQALGAEHTAVRASMRQAAAEENDHLAWCNTRLRELGSRPSILNPVFYAGSFCIGALAGKIGDRWSLGFVAETEHQVVRHLEKHLKRLPAKDHKSQAILAQMKIDEQRHATQALAAGGASLPLPIRLLMKTVSKTMTKSTYWV